ncbi:MAG: tRNA (N(6)-L-threonylcarbamoyladenosine(37)-C(2))-methylthiotransferase MtaB [Candidatus Altimarinota bacterium]
MEYKVFGCKTNRYFAEKWLMHPHLEGKGGYFIASCVVTDKAKAKWLKHAKRVIPKLEKNQSLYLSGCGNIRDGVVDPKFYEIYPELSDYREKIEILPEDPEDFTLTPEQKKEIMVSKIRKLRSLKKEGIFTRKFLVVQTGCDNFCTFCLTVQARGRHKWRPIDEILEEINDFIDGGGKEVVLTGINLGAWGSPSSNDFQLSKFVELVEVILRKTTINRLRISSLGVEFMSDELISLFGKKRINPYVHLSIQSASSKILKAMNRHYTGDRLREVLEKLRNVKREDGQLLNIGADLIVGFPGETEEDFGETKEIVEVFKITQLHAFPFSAHIDHYHVPAGTYPNQVPNHVIQRRLKELLHVGERTFLSFAENAIGKEYSVLLERVNGQNFSGWSENYLYCNETNFEVFPGQELRRGAIIHGIYKSPIIHSNEEG